MNFKYRTYEPNTNSIFSTKLIAGQYIPIKSRVRQPSYKSLKKKSVDYPGNLRIFEKSQMPKRVLSKNDRLDLYLEGGTLREDQKVFSNTYQNRIFFKGGKIKRKDFISAAKNDKNILKNEIEMFYQSVHELNRDNSLNAASKDISPRKCNGREKL